MQVPPSLTAVKSCLLAAEQNAVTASYSKGAFDVVDALRRTRENVTAATSMLDGLCPLDPKACAVAESLRGLKEHMDAAMRQASKLEPGGGTLPVGAVDPVFEGLAEASNILFASRWG